MSSVTQKILLFSFILTIFLISYFFNGQKIIRIWADPVTGSIDHFQIYKDDAGLNSATGYANQDTNYNVPANTNFRIRFGMAIQSGPGTFAARLEFKEDAGAWTQITTNSNNVRLSASANFNDGDATTNRLTVTSGYSFVAGQGKYNSSDAAAISHASNVYPEDEWSLKFQSAAVGHAYQFRITNAGSVGSLTYNVTPSISPVSNSTTPVLRIKNKSLRIKNKPLRVRVR